MKPVTLHRRTGGWNFTVLTSAFTASARSGEPVSFVTTRTVFTAPASSMSASTTTLPFAPGASLMRIMGGSIMTSLRSGRQPSSFLRRSFLTQPVLVSASFTWTQPSFSSKEVRRVPFVAFATVGAFVDGVSRTLTVFGTIQEISAA